MSIIHFIMFVLISSYQLKAQYQHGSKMIGGNVAASIRNNSNPNGWKNRSFYFSINPNVAFFVSDKTAMGGGFQFSRNKSKLIIDDINETYSKNYGIGIMPLVRTYIVSNLYSELSLGFMYHISEGSYFSNGRVIEYGPSSSSGFTVRPNLGYSHFLNESSAIEVMLGYTYSTYGTDNCCGSKDHSLVLAIGVQVFLK